MSTSAEDAAIQRKAALKALALKQQKFQRKKPGKFDDDSDDETKREPSVSSMQKSMLEKMDTHTTKDSADNKSIIGQGKASSTSTLESKNPSFMTNITAPKQEMFIEEKDYKLALLKSKLLVSSPVWQSHSLKSRLAKFEGLLAKMRDPVDGIEFKDQGMLKVQPACTTGYEIAVWALKTLNAAEPIDVKVILQNMVDYGYLIPLDDQSQTFKEDDGLYTQQADFFYASKPWQISDYDYYAYLKRQSNLDSHLTARLTQLKAKVEGYPEIIQEIKDKQKQHFGKLSRSQKKLFELRESAFWNYWMPKPTSRLYVEQTPIEALSKRRFSQATYETKLKPERLLKYMTNQNLNLNACVNVYRLPASAAIKNLMTRIDLWQRFDPLARPDRFKNNHWYNAANVEIPEEVLPDAPTYSHVRLWSLGLRDLLNDPLGIKCFMQFCEKDFAAENLKFYLETLELDSIFDAFEYYDKCAALARKYVATGSPYELNLLASTRDSILKSIADAALAPKTLKIAVMQDAQDHILHLMQSASYQRFLQSPEIKKILQDQ